MKLVVEEWRQTAIELSCVTDHAGGSIEHSLQLLDNLVVLCSGERSGAPVVVVVMEGDFDTLNAASEAVEADIPLLVFAGSGKASDFIAEVYKSREKPLVLYDVTNSTS